jgi:hypothetical protein
MIRGKTLAIADERVPNESDCADRTPKHPRTA